jgi:hypothetical protein
MTSRWGPMGWITLHSISLNYPVNPTHEDKGIVKRFLDRFAECITCPSCKNHFTTIFANYQRRHPEWANTRFDLFLFIVRAHNTVNKRLDKPILATVKDCLDTLKNISKITHFSVYRQNYMSYILTNWGRQFDGEGMIMANVGRDLIKINNEYWNLRETDINTIEFPEENVMEFVPENRPINPPGLGTISLQRPVGFRIKGGKLSLGGR